MGGRRQLGYRRNSLAAELCSSRSTSIVAMQAGAALLAAALACAYIALHGGHRMPFLAVMWIVPLAGFTLGALNGWIIARGRMQPFIVTLAAMVGVARRLA
ncbi:hypothetical protein BPUN_4283 [Candidatus Paraburkholderia kirkii]|nr:hypothetical protein BPUN_4283 [Candidatus Paraburkholderia kirkii]